MKKELLKARKLGLLALAFASFSSSQAADSSKDGAHSASVQGRAVFSVEDVKTLLSLGARDPSSDASLDHRSKQDVSNGAFLLNLSSAEKAELSQRVNKIEKARAELVAKSAKTIAGSKDSIRAKRREIQVQRMNSTSEQADRALSQRLFSNLVQESNAQVVQERALSDFDRENSFVFEFEELGGTRFVKQIKVSTKIVWLAQPTATLAKK